MDVGVIDTGAVSLIVMLLSRPDERPTYYETVFLPAMQALTIE